MSIKEVIGYQAHEHWNHLLRVHESISTLCQASTAATKGHSGAATAPPGDLPRHLLPREPTRNSDHTPQTRSPHRHRRHPVLILIIAVHVATSRPCARPRRLPPSFKPKFAGLASEMKQSRSMSGDAVKIALLSSHRSRLAGSGRGGQCELKAQMHLHLLPRLRWTHTINLFSGKKEWMKRDASFVTGWIDAFKNLDKKGNRAWRRAMVRART